CLRPGRRRRDLDDELRHFFSAAVEAHLARGLSRTEAVRAASIELGSRDAVQDHVRDVGWESSAVDAWRDVRYAARALRAAPGFTAAVSITLGLGLGLNIAIFSMADALMFRTLPVAAPHELFALYES